MIPLPSSPILPLLKAIPAHIRYSYNINANGQVLYILKDILLFSNRFKLKKEKNIALPSPFLGIDLVGGATLWDIRLLISGALQSNRYTRTSKESSATSFRNFEKPNQKEEINSFVCDV